MTGPGSAQISAFICRWDSQPSVFGSRRDQDVGARDKQAGEQKVQRPREHQNPILSGKAILAAKGLTGTFAKLAWHQSGNLPPHPLDGWASHVPNKGNPYLPCKETTELAHSYL